MVNLLRSNNSRKRADYLAILLGLIQKKVDPKMLVLNNRTTQCKKQ